MILFVILLISLLVMTVIEILVNKRIHDRLDLIEQLIVIDHKILHTLIDDLTVE